MMMFSAKIPYLRMGKKERKKRRGEEERKEKKKKKKKKGSKRSNKDSFISHCRNSSYYDYH